MLRLNTCLQLMLLLLPVVSSATVINNAVGLVRCPTETSRLTDFYGSGLEIPLSSSTPWNIQLERALTQLQKLSKTAALKTRKELASVLAAQQISRDPSTPMPFYTVDQKLKLTLQGQCKLNGLAQFRLHQLPDSFHEGNFRGEIWPSLAANTLEMDPSAISLLTETEKAAVYFHIALYNAIVLAAISQTTVTLDPIKEPSLGTIDQLLFKPDPNAGQDPIADKVKKITSFVFSNFLPTTKNILASDPINLIYEDGLSTETTIPKGEEIYTRFGTMASVRIQIDFFDSTHFGGMTREQIEADLTETSREHSLQSIAPYWNDLLKLEDQSKTIPGQVMKPIMITRDPTQANRWSILAISGPVYAQTKYFLNENMSNFDCTEKARQLLLEPKFFALNEIDMKSSKFWRYPTCRIKYTELKIAN